MVQELPELLKEKFGGLDMGKLCVSGHSMGGHGALTIALKNKGLFRSVTVFAPICHPSAAPWGIKAFTGYLGEEQAAWAQYDATLLMGSVAEVTAAPILLDQGSSDKFLDQLQPQAFLAAAAARNVSVDYREREGYDHSYYYIASFIGEHFDFHLANLH